MNEFIVITILIGSILISSCSPKIISSNMAVICGTRYDTEPTEKVLEGYELLSGENKEAYDYALLAFRCASPY